MTPAGIRKDRWKQNLYLIWIAQILSLTGFGFMMPFLPYYIQDVGVTDPVQVRFWVGIISSIPGLFLALMAPIWGILADKFGRKLMIMRSMLAGAILVFLMSFAKTIYMVFALRVIQSILCGTVTAAATLVAAGTPRARLSYALGILSSSTFIGFSVGPLIGGIAAELVGYRNSFQIGGLVLLVGFFVVLLFIRELRAEDTGPVAPPKDKKTGRPNFLTLLRSPLGVLFVLVFLIRFCRMLPYSFLSIYIQELRGTVEGSSAVMGLVSALAGGLIALAAIMMGKLADKHDKHMLIRICLAGGAIFSLPIFFVEGLLKFVAFYAIAAFAVGGVEPVLQSAMSEHSPPDKRGFFFGIQTLVSSSGFFLSPLVASAISINISTKHIYLFYSVALAGTLLISIMMGPKARIPRLIPRALSRRS